ncbi:class I SAM-dependent DNA methyltransferase [Alicyclobacillus vulcanalis]|uniref:Ubiquinone/menaquinone biosynthesis C-methylase UbiE n=1 Tax=Alicyclobacillus vulcanalis TaxID=252246 RepID=A0A1N7L004_9BACL|nr:class I SAM-dependent methyltransferase [Alicyclobacillus vulcanalis]SIS67151.1 Ubiquinone/menaquinone biosynthesis C-methylase UbiE [Alicyclobacillus vulcanalis]
MAYEHLAPWYDALMGETVYKAWQSALSRRLSPVRAAVDLGCGTGVMAAWLAERAEIVYAVDASPDMLAVAFDRWGHLPNVRWIQSDLCDLELPEAADFALASTDVLNYLLTREHMESALCNIGACVREGGVWALDTLGPRRIEALRGGVWHDVRDDLAVLHETDVDGETIVHRVLGFVAVDEEEGLFVRFEEEHVQRYWDAETLSDLFARTGWDVVEVTGDFGASPLQDADRISWLLKRRSGG